MKKKKWLPSFYTFTILTMLVSFVLLQILLCLSYGRIYSRELFRERHESVIALINNTIWELSSFLNNMEQRFKYKALLLKDFGDKIPMTDKNIQFLLLDPTSSVDDISVAALIPVEYLDCLSDQNFGHSDQNDQVSDQKNVNSKDNIGISNANKTNSSSEKPRFNLPESKYPFVCVRRTDDFSVSRESINVLRMRVNLPQLKMVFQNNTPVWSDPYIDPVNGALNVAFYMPFVDNTGKVAAVILFAIPINKLDIIIKNSAIGQFGTPIFYMHPGKLAILNDQEWLIGDLVYNWLANAPDRESKNYYSQLQDMFSILRSDKIKIEPDTQQNFSENCFGYLEQLRWHIGCKLADSKLTDLVCYGYLILFLFCILGILAAVVTTGLIVRRIAKPIGELAELTRSSATDKADSNLSYPYYGCREVVDLVEAFKQMHTKILQHTKEQKKLFDKEEKIKEPLKIASNLQQEMLSTDFQLPKLRNIDLFASIHSASLEKGGNHYDFRMLDDYHLYFFIAKVSAKGVPASLFVSLALAFVRSAVMTAQTPADILGLVNQQLKKRNSEGLYISCICGIYDLAKHEIILANAGLNPPILLQNGKQPEKLNVPTSLPLAVRKDTVYENFTCPFNIKDLFFIHTDEIIYAMNKMNEPFGTERLTNILYSEQASPVQTIAEKVMETVNNFTEGEKMMDDMTILLFRQKK